MKKFQVTLLIALIGLWCISMPQAAFAIDVPVSAQVPNNSPDITIVIKELTTPSQDPFTGTTVQSMNFGQLTHTLTGGTDAGVWFSSKYFCVIIFTNSFGHKYEIRSTCAGLTSGGNSLPTGSFGLTPGYSTADRWIGTDATTAQGTQPEGSQLGSAISAITGLGAFRSIYLSEPAATNRIIRAVYSLPTYGAGGALPFPGYTPIPLSQPGGTTPYTGTVTITIAEVG